MNLLRMSAILLGAAALATPAAAPAQYLADGMVVHYTFDDALNLAADALGNHPGTLNAGTTSVPAHSTGSQGIGSTATHVTGAGAISFEDVNGYVQVADGTNSPLDTATGAGQARTVSFWFQTTAEANQVVMEKGENQHFVAQTGGDGKPFWRVWKSTGNARSLTDVQNGVWHHFAGVHVDDANYLYIDGVYQGQGAALDPAPAANNSSLVLGARSGGQFAYEGKLDDVAIWSRQLSAAEIKLMFTAGKLGLDASQAALPFQIMGVTYEYGDATTSKPHSTYPDTGGTELTDIYSTLNHTNSFTHPAWVGFRGNAGLPDDPHPQITFDLDGKYNLDEIRIIYMGGNYAGINPPDSVWVSFSDDGLLFSNPTEYTPFADTPALDPDSLTVEEALVEIGGEWARYVRMEFRNDGQWTFLGDVAFVAVPEPATFVLFAMGALLALMSRRRRRHAGQ
ncbi:MAG: LamG-like jellyroll fold domain-containing protein [Thermoguttaceae bacterium]|jgi:hypothetical protein|nr:LamG-like jellyroll fold domain-containing protein [Thermoguttaceae bacterium]